MRDNPLVTLAFSSTNDHEQSQHRNGYADLDSSKLIGKKREDGLA
jgi:hypothetical protein